MELVLHTAPGLERLLWAELSEREPHARRVATHVVPGRDALVLAEGAGVTAARLCRTADDVFVVLARGPVSSGREGLTQVDALCTRLRDLDAAMQEQAAVQGGRGSRASSTFRVIVRAAGDRAYRRIDVQRRAEAALQPQFGRHWRVAGSQAHLEVWMTLVGSEAILALRVTGAEQRHRGKVAHIPGSLRAVVAAALVRVSDPQPDDRVLDPFCGAGTILIERDLAGRHALMIGSDTAPAALEAAAANIGPRHKPVELHRWDATAVPLAGESIDCILTNPPFGAKVAITGLAGLERRFIDEAARLLRPGGRLVLLSAAPGRIQRLVAGGRWTAVRLHPLETQGRAACIIYAVRV